MKQIVPVLMYHHVTPAGGMINTIPELFDAQLKGLTDAGYHTLTTQEFHAFLQGHPVPEKSVLITFDDGYLNNWVYAHPILAKYKMNAVLFLITGMIGDGAVRPHYGLAEELPECPEHKICKQYQDSEQYDHVMLRWSEVKAMQQAGTFEFHSHTHTHTRWDLQLPQAEKIAAMNEEMQRSRQTLTDRLGQCSEHLCWPQGYFDEDYLQLATANGFSTLYTTRAYGFNVSSMDRRFIYRIPTRNKGSRWLRRRLWLARSPIIGSIYNSWKQYRKNCREARQANATATHKMNFK